MNSELKDFLVRLAGAAAMAAAPVALVALLTLPAQSQSDSAVLARDDAAGFVHLS